jgi:GH35 family endo-1,4-beta-xylanase
VDGVVAAQGLRAVPHSRRLVVAWGATARWTWLAGREHPASKNAPQMAFLDRLLQRRPTFAQDMSAAEADAMQRRVAYWQDLLNRDVALALPPRA